MNQPDPQKHLNMSIWKSGVRIIGYAVLAGAIGFAGAPTAGAVAGIILIISEILGIVEELV